MENSRLFWIRWSIVSTMAAFIAAGVTHNTLMSLGWVVAQFYIGLLVGTLREERLP